MVKHYKTTVRFFNIILFICLACWSLCCCVGFPLVVESRLLIEVASLVLSTGFRVHGAPVVAGGELSSCITRALEHRLNSWGTQAWLLHSTRDLPGSRIEPMSPALAGGFFINEPSGKPKTTVSFSKDKKKVSLIYIIYKEFLQSKMKRPLLQ